MTKTEAQKRRDAEKVPLSLRLRPDIECAPWVIGEVMKLEAALERLRARESIAAINAVGGGGEALEGSLLKAEAVKAHDGSPLFNEARTRLITLEAERDRCKADSRRYRWLMQWFQAWSVNIDGNHSWRCMIPSRITGASISEAIDKEMANKAEK